MTEVIETEKKLEKTRSSFSEIMNAINDSIWSIDTNMQLEHFNEAFERLHKEIFGVRTKSGMTIYKMIPPDKFPEDYEIVRMNYLSALYGIASNVEREFIVNGCERYFYSTFAPVLLDVQVRGVVVVRE
ncbi:MAG: hypothetical protein DWQ33_02905 [Bacteroidetes bacterium]|nr:MAG: hypothetical protein DWQ33_02905 [Bacteroidota bacterium]